MTEKARDTAILVGFDEHGVEVFRDRIGLFEYWEDLHPVIDDADFRSSRRVTKLSGKLYASDGSLVEEFENSYDSSGTLVSSRARHQDGTRTAL